MKAFNMLTLVFQLRAFSQLFHASHWEELEFSKDLIALMFVSLSNIMSIKMPEVYL